jgi:hypothetical protein
MPTTLTVEPMERGALKVTCGPFKDESGATVTPKTVAWTLTDAKGAVVNGRSAVSVTPATTVSFLLSGLDLAVDGTGVTLFGRHRKIWLEWTYDSSLGSDVPGRDEVTFKVFDAVYPTGAS